MLVSSDIDFDIDSNRGQAIASGCWLKWKTDPRCAAVKSNPDLRGAAFLTPPVISLHPAD